ncbi:MAG: CDP-archaeol synthase [Pseudomonadales bacterium]|nr:CDP-archaeol synthase [Pseudomonadales bacterium]
MLQTVLLAFYLLIPVIFAGVLHMMAVTWQWLPSLARPLHIRSFGQNKTWRGLILMPLFCMLGTLLLLPWDKWVPHSPYHHHPMLLAGLAAGLGYVLAELPNSFLKRRLGIPPGATSSRFTLAFTLLDQMDSGIGVALAYLAVLGLDRATFVALILGFPITALLVKQILYRAHLKDCAR